MNSRLSALYKFSGLVALVVLLSACAVPTSTSLPPTAIPTATPLPEPPLGLMLRDYRSETSAGEIVQAGLEAGMVYPLSERTLETLWPYCDLTAARAEFGVEVQALVAENGLSGADLHTYIALVRVADGRPTAVLVQQASGRELNRPIVFGFWENTWVPDLHPEDKIIEFALPEGIGLGFVANPENLDESVLAQGIWDASGNLIPVLYWQNPAWAGVSAERQDAAGNTWVWASGIPQRFDAAAGAWLPAPAATELDEAAGVRVGSSGAAELVDDEGNGLASWDGEGWVETVAIDPWLEEMIQFIPAKFPVEISPTAVNVLVNGTSQPLAARSDRTQPWELALAYGDEPENFSQVWLSAPADPEAQREFLHRLASDAIPWAEKNLRDDQKLVEYTSNLPEYPSSYGIEFRVPTEHESNWLVPLVIARATDGTEDYFVLLAVRETRESGRLYPFWLRIDRELPTSIATYITTSSGGQLRSEFGENTFTMEGLFTRAGLVDDPANDHLSFSVLLDDESGLAWMEKMLSYANDSSLPKSQREGAQESYDLAKQISLDPRVWAGLDPEDRARMLEYLHRYGEAFLPEEWEWFSDQMGRFAWPIRRISIQDWCQTVVESPPPCNW